MHVLSTPVLADRFREICGSRYVFTDADTIGIYGRDQTGDLHFPFEVLVKPGSPEEIAAVLKLCSQYRVSVTPRGGGSGVTGGALPVAGGVVLSMERLNRIISIDVGDGCVTAEAGVITADLCAAVEREGLYFPVAPTSSPFCMIGGNVAENAGSVRSCKYGTTGSYVLNLEVVLPSGDIIWTGANVVKNATGLNLTQLFVGSEGILGIITKVVYRLLPAAPGVKVLRAAFPRMTQACEAVVAIRRSGISPSAVELIGRNAIRYVTAYKGEPPALTSEHIEAYLLIELREQDEWLLEHSLEKTAALLGELTGEDILVAGNAAEIGRLWQLREEVGAALADSGLPYRDLDVSLPVSCLAAFIEVVDATCAAYGIDTICFGHAGDGNLHTMLIPRKSADSETAIHHALRAIYSFAISKGGVISGEHGIGYLQKDFMSLQFPAAHLHLLSEIKALFDPHGILNPGKVI